MTQKLRIGVPKGSLQDATFALFKKAGWDFRVSARSYQPVVDDDELDPVLLRAQEIPRYVAMGVLDCGLTGHDNVVESEADVYEVSELIYSKATSRPYRWVLAVPNDSAIAGPHAAGKHDPPDRQPPLLGGRLEAHQGREPAIASARRAGRRQPGGPEDERRQGEPGRRRPPSVLPPQAHRLTAG